MNDGVLFEDADDPVAPSASEFGTFGECFHGFSGSVFGWAKSGRCRSSFVPASIPLLYHYEIG